MPGSNKYEFYSYDHTTSMIWAQQECKQADDAAGTSALSHWILQLLLLLPRCLCDSSLQHIPRLLVVPHAMKER